MKRGDIFKVGAGEQLYYADAIAPNGGFEEGWDYCKIGQKREEVAPYAYETRWVAQTIGSTQTIVGKSREISYEWRDGQESSVKPETAAKWRQDLVDELMDQGWQVLDGQYEGYLRRKQ